MSGDAKMPCGCYGKLLQQGALVTWIVTAEAFLCPQKHKQGDVIVGVDPARPA